MAEGTSLLRMHTAYTCIVSSNLTVSASYVKKAPARELFFRPVIGELSKLPSTTVQLKALQTSECGGIGGG